MKFMREVAELSDGTTEVSTGNKMDLDNLATVLAPNLIYSKSQNPMDDDSVLCKMVVKMIMEYQDEIWKVGKNLKVFFLNIQKQC